MSRSRLSISVTRTPRAANMLAYSQPITPAPTTANVLGKRSRHRISSLVKIRGSVERGSRIAGGLRSGGADDLPRLDRARVAADDIIQTNTVRSDKVGGGGN